MEADFCTIWFESLHGLKVGAEAEFTGHMLEVTLGPGMLSKNYDGLQNDLDKMEGVFFFAVIALCNEILQKLHINGNVEDFSFARNRAWIAVGMVIVCVGFLGISIKSSEHIMEKMEEF